MAFCCVFNHDFSMIFLLDCTPITTQYANALLDTLMMKNQEEIFQRHDKHIT